MEAVVRSRGSGKRSQERKPARWRPLLRGDTAKEALAAVEAIAEDVLKFPPSFSRARRKTSRRSVADASLVQGLAGLAVFFGYLSRAGLGDRYESAARRYLDAAGDAVGAVTMGPSLYGGFTGIAWAFAHLERQLFGSSDDRSTDAVDETLRELVHRRGWRGDYDLIVGLVGLGVYALETLPAPAAVACLEGVVDRLEETSHRGPDGVSWHTAPELLSPWQLKLCPNGYYNLGLAHGCPGVIALLGAAWAAGIRRHATRRLLDGGVTWLLNHERRERTGTRFSAWISPGLPSEDCRSAWCYGDPGVAVALFWAARGVGQPAWEKEALRIARSAAARRPEKSGVQDAGLCHGAAGLALIFNRMYQATGDAALRRAARYWIEKTLAMRRRGRGIGGFQSLQMRDDGTKYWVDDPGLLTGAAGIGLALLAAATPIEPEWDRTLLVSMRSVGERGHGESQR